MMQGQAHSLPNFETALRVQQVVEDLLDRTKPPAL
jgi:hypothetical protein